MSECAAGWLVGKLGSHIRELSELTGAILNVANDSDPPLGDGERCLRIQGRHVSISFSSRVLISS